MTDVIICSTKSAFDDDLVTSCTRCRQILYIRPSSQRVMERWCESCAMSYLIATGTSIRGILPESVKELAAILRR